MKPRAQLKHALIRVNLLNLAKVRALKRLFGITSKLALVEVYLTMSCATNAVISRDAILDIAEDNEVQDPEGFFSYCLKEGLIQPEMDGFSNSVVIEDQEAYAKKLKMKSDESPITPASPPDSPGKNPGNSPGENGFPDTDSDNEIVNDLNLKITVPPEPIPEESDEFLKLAYERLESPTNQPWTRKPLFVNTGRRPMKDYPNLHWTPVALANVLKTWVEAGIPGEKFRQGFLSAEARAREAAQNGKPPPNAEAWCLGFVMNELMQNVTQELRMNTAKERKYATTNR